MWMDDSWNWRQQIKNRTHFPILSFLRLHFTIFDHNSCVVGIVDCDTLLYSTTTVSNTSQKWWSTQKWGVRKIKYCLYLMDSNHGSKLLGAESSRWHRVPWKRTWVPRQNGSILGPFMDYVSDRQNFWYFERVEK